jgi:hypothetical protein
VERRVVITEAECETKTAVLCQALEDARDEAVRLIKESFDAVSRVAEQLRRRGRVPGDEIASIVLAAKLN